MKKIFIFIVTLLITEATFCQSVLLTPNNISNVSTNGGSNENIVLTKYSSLDGGYIIGRNATGTPVAPGATTNDNYLLLLGARGHNGSSFTSTSSAAIILRANQAWTPTANGSNILFGTTANNTTFRTTRMMIDHDGQVAIGSHTPNALLDVRGDFALTKKVFLKGNGGHNDFDRAGASVISIADPTIPAPNGGGTETVTGIAGGVDGLVIHLYPVQGTSLILANESTSSVDANRIITWNASSVTITNNGGCTLIYDGTVQRWRIIGIAN